MRNFKCLGRATFASALLSLATPAGAVTVLGDFLVDQVNSGFVSVGIDGLTTSFSIGDVFATEIDGNASDGGGSIAFSFTATQDLTALETNSLNPSSGFTGAAVEWNSLADGTGTIFASLTTAQILANQTMTVSFLLGQVKYLIASWTDVVADRSNFDLRVEAIPLPPAALLFGSALVGLGFVARRRRRKQGSQAA